MCLMVDRKQQLAQQSNLLNAVLRRNQLSNHTDLDGIDEQQSDRGKVGLPEKSDTSRR